MDVVTTSLEALIQRATNSQNQKPDVAAIEAFCVLLTKEAEGIQIGTKLLATHIQSLNESEALQALSLLDTCMKKCGPLFHAEVGKFRFLNEMIKLVSPKYLGGRTTATVRQKVLQLLYAWIREYPRELKIKEAYEMLKKQGVIEEDAAFIMANSEESQKSSKLRNSIFENEEMSKHLRKLLHSKDPYDLQTANRLIKVMVKEDEERLQLSTRRHMELESVHNNVKLLSEMLDSYNQNETSAEDLELMKELHQACERLKPMLLRLASETQGNVEMLGDVLAASDELSQVFEKYTSVIVLGQSTTEPSKANNFNNGSSLLDLSSPTENVPCESTLSTPSATSTDHRSDMDVLGDIFSVLEKPIKSDASLLMPNNIMQPISVSPVSKKNEVTNNEGGKIDSKAKALEELNELGETLLKQSLSSARSSQGKLNNNATKIAIGDSVWKQNWSHETNTSDASQRITTEQLEHTKCETNSNSETSVSANTSKINVIADSCNNSNTSAVIPDARIPQQQHQNVTQLRNGSSRITDIEPEIKPLTDINVNLEDITPGTNPPLTVIEERNGITVVLHFAQDSPRPDVSVVVITTMSKNTKPLSNYQFQAVVPKKCKCRLQAPSGMKLPAHNPFLPPSAITQIMLIANPLKEPVSLKFMLSYTLDDETFTEMGEVDKLPHL
ncbi:ADP-ribosylation factor-binding protein GGA3 [Harpegnathos saltator]|uniref:ADP-ribosylation factor-binding protein GGA1 n=1 Tax=Harpegnathos saltator TaxID=610380 RepID=E2BSS0_HARSA|nr:ADP-ribosylation factor-binding protein GGA3 [Harpegnathos saltator]XP_011144494.1 ADP-ribosylation factor-binding protein GGA3 [Harpegnathos saltator]EFN81316.1 ADP-ribosylation factor-binding protein GGA1 [Harpegnathos saltator]